VERVNAAAPDAMRGEGPALRRASSGSRGGDWALAADAMMAQARRENFPVALRCLPAALRRDLLALYGFARLADDLGDELEGDRLACLDALEADLARAFQGEAHHPLLRRLTPTLRVHALPREPFQRLIEANRRDQRVRRYRTFEELRALSDAICTALQIAEHLQDVAEDLARDRIYLPAQDLARFGCTEQDLRRAPAPPRLRRLLAFEAQRARALLRSGEPLLARLRHPGRLAVAGFAAGGHAALDALERGGFDVGSRCLAPRRRDLLRRAVQLLWRARRERGPS
jgi:phytoene/squalene synthetase